MNKTNIPTYTDKFNVMIAGDAGVGKTSILGRYCRGVFKTEQKVTRGIEQLTKEFTFNNETFLFKLWDTIKDAKLEHLAKAYYSKADCILIVCSINNKDSLDNIQKWVDSIAETIEIKTVNMILIANKCDLEDERQIGLDEVRQKAEELNMDYYETSAMSGYGIDEAFEFLFEKVIKGIYKNNKEKSIKGDVSKENNEASSMKTVCFLI